MRFNFLIFLSFIFASNFSCFSQNGSIKINGYVRDAFSKEVIIGAKVYLPDFRKGVVTNSAGYYSLEIPRTDSLTQIQISAIGFKTLRKTISLDNDTRLDFELAVTTTSDVEVVYSDPNQVSDPEIGVLSMPVSQLKNIPNLGGEPDVIKAFQMMPGVSGGKEGTSGLYVRGGTPDQNLFLLDDVPLYYVNHIGGFVSTFDPNAINSIKLYKGGFPAQYAGRLSSVVDIRMKDGNLSKHMGELSVGLLTTKINFEGPIGKDSSMSYFVSARRFNLDLVVRPIARVSTDGKNTAGYTFYDLNGKIVKRFSDGSKLSLTIYEGRDRIFLNGSEKRIGDNDVGYRFRSNVKWGNLMGTVVYSRPLTNKVFMFSSVSTTNFKYNNTVNARFSKPGEDELVNTSRISFISGINDVIAKTQFEIQAHSAYLIKAGATTTYHSFLPGRIDYESFENDTVVGNNRLSAFETNAFIENHLKIGKHVFINAGLNFNSFFLKDTTFYALQPRVMATVYFTKNLTMQMGYSRMTQNLHYLANSGLGLPSDLWVPATKDLIPEVSNQYNIGFIYAMRNKNFPINFVVEAFYKEMNNLIEFKDGISLFTSNSIEEKIVKNGTGTVYGIEFLAQKSVGRLTGWIGYTWSKNTRQFADLNNGNPFPFVFDRRHDFSLVLSYKLKDDIVLNATWVYMTGNAITFGQSQQLTPELIQNFYFFPLGIPNTDFYFTQLYNGRNGFRMPAFHKLDVGVNLIKRKSKGTRTWFFGVYNLYNQANPFFLFYKRNNVNQVSLHQLTLFPIIPSFSYSFVFDTKKVLKRKKQ
jgi:hypothetical protein